MVNLKRLEANGVTTDKLRSVFTNLNAKGNEKAHALVEHIRDCLRSGVDRNLRDWKLFWSIDKAYDAPFYQVSYTQLQGLLENPNGYDQNKVMEQVNRWGLTHLLSDMIDPKTGQPCCDGAGNKKKSLNLPIFFNLFVPLVAAYVTIRWAKLFNERNLSPLYKYEPAKFTKVNRVRCEIITEIVQILATNYNYKDDERQAILQTLLYSFCMKVPRECWHTVKQEDDAGKEVIVKEGLRFHMPHPSRLYYDLFYRPSTFNSDTGCKYIGYWEIRPYKDLKANPDYWNTDKISYGINSWFTTPLTQDFFSMVYPCTLKFPRGPITPSSTVGAGEQDRENESTWYGNQDSNAATLITEHFHKLVPADHGLGDYKYPVWFRFVLANECTVVWCEPLAYCPVAFYGYDFDGNRSRNKSLALEVLPFQDMLGQTLTQWILSVRQNLINPVFVDEDLVGQEVLNELKNTGERLVRGRTFIPFSRTDNYQLGNNEKEAFHAPILTRHDTSQLSSLIKGILDILDRVLVLSSQEIGQSAPHEQTAEEVRKIATTTSTRIDFTGSFIDEGIYATKKILYDAFMAYGEEDFVSSISQSYAPTEEEFKALLKQLDIDPMDEDAEDMSADGKRAVKGNKSALELEVFASTRDASDRIDSPSVAAAMSQVFQSVANNPVLIQSVGVDQLIDLLNQVISVAGLPKDFKLRAVNKAQSPEDQTKALQEQLVQFAQKTKEAIDESAKNTAQAVMQQTAQAMQQLAKPIEQQAQMNEQQGQQIQELQQAVEKMAQIIVQHAQTPPPPPQQFMAPPPETTNEGIPIAPGIPPPNQTPLPVGGA